MRRARSSTLTPSWTKAGHVATVLDMRRAPCSILDSPPTLCLHRVLAFTETRVGLWDYVFRDNPPTTVGSMECRDVKCGCAAN